MTEVALCGDVSDQLREVAAFGAVVSTVTLITDDNPVLPAESVALVWKVCEPCESEVAE